MCEAPPSPCALMARLYWPDEEGSDAGELSSECTETTASEHGSAGGSGDQGGAGDQGDQGDAAGPEGPGGNERGSECATVLGPMMGLRQVHDPVVTAVVYRRTLRFVDPTEPLYGTPYIGQAVRVGTAETIAERRWREEDTQMNHKPKDIGLIKAIEVFGPDAFDNEVLESRRGPRDKVAKWANRREIALIAEHGGCLQTMNPAFPGAVRQTLNQTKGGKFTNWASIDALYERNWHTFVAELDMYREREGHANVPYGYVSPSGHKLGQQLHNVRQGRMLSGKPDEAERRAFLEGKGVKWTIAKEQWDAAWHTFKTAMEAHVKAKGTSRVNNGHKTKDGLRLGRAVRDIICKGQFVKRKPERVAWLESLPGWRWSGKYQPPKAREGPTSAETDRGASLVARIAAKARAKRKRGGARRTLSVETRAPLRSAETP